MDAESILAAGVTAVRRGSGGRLSGEAEKHFIELHGSHAERFATDNASWEAGKHEMLNVCETYRMVAAGVATALAHQQVGSEALVEAMRFVHSQRQNEGRMTPNCVAV